MIPTETLRTAPVAPSKGDVRAVFGDPSSPAGHQAGIGMPIAPMPTVEEALALGTVEAFGDGPSYVYSVDRPGLGTVTYRVHFVVGGRSTLAPVSLGGNVSMRWHAEGGGALHEEDWTLTVDPTRGVEILDGQGVLIGNGFTTVRSAASAYALPVDGSAPYGQVSWSIESARDGSFVRNETHHGTGAIDVDVR